MQFSFLLCRRGLAGLSRLDRGQPQTANVKNLGRIGEAVKWQGRFFGLFRKIWLRHGKKLAPALDLPGGVREL
jgi:hypothetical protein